MKLSDIAVGALKYAVGATAAFVMGHLFFGKGAVGSSDIVIAALIALPLCFAFFFVIFYLAWRRNGNG